MTDADPALFYTGLVAELYAGLRSTDPDPEPYRRFIGSFGEPALELGCGDGDPLLALRRAGFDVEGLDSSADMLTRCRERADDLGIAVTLHETTIEAMDLGRCYRSIFLAGPTFNLLPDDATAARALARLRAHLEPDGGALIPLFVPEPIAPEDLGRGREHRTEDGAVMRCTAVSCERDERTRRQVSVLRYELDAAGRSVSLERSWILHWHTADGFRRLAAETGFVVAAVLDANGDAAAPDADEFAFLLTPA